MVLTEAFEDKSFGGYIFKRESDFLIKGVYYENVTDAESEVKNKLRVHIELNSSTSGTGSFENYEGEILLDISLHHAIFHSLQVYLRLRKR